MNSSLHFIGKNIRFFRRSRNWTLAALASKIGIQEGPLGRIERGVNLPSAAVIYNLTQALEIPADALFARDLAQARAAYTDADTMLVSIDPDARIPQKSLLSACHDIMTAFHALEDILGVQKHAFIPLSVPFEPDYPGMDSLAERMRIYLGTGDAVVFDYLELLENFGLRIILFPFPPNTSEFEALSFYEPVHHNAFFFINTRNNPEKQLFSLARELGKILIFNQTSGRKTPLFTPIETENENRPITEARAAKRFAASFLMPETAVRATVTQLGVSKNTWSWELLLRIKHRFGVSAEAFLYRLAELDLISQKLTDQLQARIKEHYSQTGFTEPDSSRRILNANGRFFDLLLTASKVDSARQEVSQIQQMVQQKKISGSKG
mgnify:CR=1 FL=1